MTDKLIVKKEGPVGHIIFNNVAKHNALSLDMWEAIKPAVDTHEADPEVKVIVVSGAGDKAFVAGADVSKYQEERMGENAQEHYARIGWEGMMALYNCSKTTIAALNGYCYGGGISVAVCCDLRYGSSTLQVAQPALRYGIGYRYKSLRLVVDVVGAAPTKELLLGAAVWNADEAYARGFVSRVEEAGEAFDGFIAKTAQRIAAGAPLTARQVKFAINQIVLDPQDRDLETAEEMFQACYASEDYAEGVTAFAEKRKPVFKGR
ncbi:enoyl-CoA hydratase [Algiphilus sp.]|uniref:enoyl-CoA hydratase n=1 Tax=Algiphilus sp. TaxID=1872431 RepID=UPI003C69197F